MAYHCRVSSAGTLVTFGAFKSAMIQEGERTSFALTSEESSEVCLPVHESKEEWLCAA